MSKNGQTEPTLHELSVGMLTSSEKFAEFRQEIELLLETKYGQVAWQLGVLDELGMDPEARDRYADLRTQVEFEGF